MKIVEQGLKIHGKVRNQGYFFKKLDLSVDDQGIMPLRMDSELLSCDPH